MARRFRVIWPIVALLVCVASIAALGSETGVLQFGVVTDIHAHDIDSPLEGKMMAKYQQRLSGFVDAMNAWPADFVIELGDFVNGWVVLGTPPGDPERIPDILAQANAVFTRFDGPAYHVIGNHDLYNLSKQQYMSILGMDRTYYSFDIRGFHFVVLDVQFDQLGHDLSYTFTGVRGLVPQEEMEWLRGDLAATDKPTIVCVHQMLDTTPTAAGWTLVQNAVEVRALLASSGKVIAVFQGHDHQNRYSLVNKIYYITFAAFVDQGTPPTWACVTLDPDARTITIKGAGKQEDWNLQY